MALRTYLDRNGVEWTVWETRPKSLDHTLSPALGVPAFSPTRGAGAPPDESAAKDAGADGPTGWLTFESSREKRRLVPVPAEWARCTDAELDALRELATPVTKRRLAE